MNKKYLLKALKIATAAVLAILTANMFHLKYTVTAGIITVLSIQNTKRETFRTARNRGMAFICALFLAALCYNLQGFTIVAFAVYLFLFSLICLCAGWQEAIAMDSVLISHFLAEESFATNLILNEILLFMIGTGYGILINLHLRKSGEEFLCLSEQVDDEIRGILQRMSENLCKKDKQDYKSDCFQRLEDSIAVTKNCALRNWNNTLWNHSQEELNYIKMRENQSRVLKNIYHSIVMITSLPSQTHMIAQFLDKVESDYRRENDCADLIAQLGTIYDNMKEEPLPATREEFEARAVLFYMLKQLEEFLLLKYQFIHNADR